MTKNSHFDRRLYQANTTSKATDKDQVIDKAIYAIVDNRHKLVTHEDGHLLVFHRRKDAFAWLLTNTSPDESNWRVNKLKLRIDLI